MNDLGEAKYFLYKQVENGTSLCKGKPFEGYQVVYFSSNENVKESINNVYQDGVDNALCVLASGDQVYELINKGVTNVDTFDKNRLTEYYVLGLKRAMILKYSYKEYLNVLKIFINSNPNKELIEETIISLLGYMDEKYRKFWKEIVDYEIRLQENNKTKYDIIALMFIHLAIPDTYPLLYGYLQDEQTYNAFKEKLLNANITFKYCNVLNLYYTFNKKYDIIYLSNILDYLYYDIGYGWGKKQLNTFKESLDKISSEDAKILLHYVFNYTFRDEFCSLIVNGSDLVESDLKQFNIRKIKGFKYSGISDANIIYDRKKVKK